MKLTYKQRDILIWIFGITMVISMCACGYFFINFYEIPFCITLILSGISFNLAINLSFGGACDMMRDIMRAKSKKYKK